MSSRYTRRHRGHRKRYTRKNRNATSRVASVAKTRTSAKAQGKQITTIAKSVGVIQKQLRENQNVDMKWRFSLTNQRLIPNQPSQGNILVFPLTSGPCGAVASGARSSLIGSTGTPDCAWVPVQPKGKSIQDSRGSTPWCKMYSGTYKLAIHSNTLRKPVRYTMYVVRLARNDETDNDNTMLQRLEQIDGTTLAGNPDTSDDFARGEDFYSLEGFDNPVLQGSTTQQGVTQSTGHLMVTLNNQRYTVVHKRECVIGMYPTSSANLPSTSSPQQVVQSFTPAGAASPTNQSYYETSWRINYGGAKVQPSNVDAAASASDPITLSDVQYKDINPKLKHWLVMFPSTTVQYPDPNPIGNTATGVPVMTLEGVISTKCPA